MTGQFWSSGCVHILYPVTACAMNSHLTCGPCNVHWQTPDTSMCCIVEMLPFTAMGSGDFRKGCGSITTKSPLHLIEHARWP